MLLRLSQQVVVKKMGALPQQVIKPKGLFVKNGSDSAALKKTSNMLLIHNSEPKLREIWYSHLLPWWPFGLLHHWLLRHSEDNQQPTSLAVPKTIQSVLPISVNTISSGNSS